MTKLFRINTLIVVLFTCAIFLNACAEEDPKVAYKREGVKVQAKIVSKYKKKFRTLDGTKRDYYLRYSFATKDGDTMESSFKVPKEIYKMIAKGDPITVEYLASSPKKNRLPLKEFEGVVD